MNNHAANRVIWYCHPYAGAPSLGMSYRPYYLSKYFNELGHKSYVITANFHHLLNQPLVQNQAVELRKIDAVDYITLKTPNYHGNGVMRLANMFSYAWQFYRNASDLVQITGKPDLIIVSSAHPFHFPILKKLAKQYQAKLVFEVRDIWPLSLIEILGISPRHPFVMLLSHLEKQAYRQADYVVSLLAEAYPHMAKKGLSRDRFRHIPNGTLVDPEEENKDLPPALAARIQSLKEDYFLIGYTGSMGPPNALSYLVEAMAALQGRGARVYCLLLGKGSEQEKLSQRIETLGLTNIELFEGIPKNAVPNFLQQMDALYLGWNDLSIYQYGTSPNKLFDYLLAGKPIIESGGSMPSLIQTQACGIHCQAANPEQIAAAIEKMAGQPPEILERFGQNAKQLASQFDYKLLARHYLDAIGCLV